MFKIISKDDGIIHKQENGVDLFCFRKFYFIMNENSQKLVAPETNRFETLEEAEEALQRYNQFSL